MKGHEAAGEERHRFELLHELVDENERKRVRLELIRVLRLVIVDDHIGLLVVDEIVARVLQQELADGILERQ